MTTPPGLLGARMAEVVALHDRRSASSRDPDGLRWEWMQAVMQDAGLLPVARLVAVSLAQRFARRGTTSCHPGTKAIEAAVSASRATVFRALLDLQLRGWLEVRHGGPNQPAVYHFVGLRNRTVQERVRKARPKRQEPTAPEQVSRLRPEQVSPGDGTGLTGEIPPTPPYKEEPNLNQNAQARAGATDKEEIDRAFEKFWRVHPRPWRKDATRQLFEAALNAGEDAEAILAGAARYAKKQAKVSYMDRVGSETWLRDRLWQEEQQAAAEELREITAKETFWVERIKTGKYIHPGSLSVAVARELLERKLVDEAELARAGVRL
jgi:hypothetical protein